MATDRRSPKAENELPPYSETEKTTMQHPWPLLYLFAVACWNAGCFPHQPGPSLAHFETSAPQLGEPAPNFRLTDLEGRSVELAELIGERPIVLQLGSHSCPVYRYRRFSMEDLFADFHDRVHFLLVYTVEAHPVGSKSPYAEGEWDTWWNRLTGVRVRQAGDRDERRRQAEHSYRKLGLEQLLIVDEMSNQVWETYGAAASPAFVIDRQGKIAARQVWIDPEKLRQTLLDLLGER